MLLIIGVAAVVGVLTLVFMLVWWRVQDQFAPERDRRFKAKPTRPAGDGDAIEGGPGCSDD